MSQALRKLTGTVARSNCLLVFINQIRMKIGVMFGSPETTTGGNALKFYASMRLDIRRIGQIKEAATSDKKDPVSIGNRTRVKVVKNKMAPPFREVEFDILYGQGISRSGDIIDLATDLGLVEKSGAWFSCGTERIGQGRENAKAYLDSHPELMERLEGQILAKHSIKRGGEAVAAPPADDSTPAPGAKASAPKADVAPDGKPVVRIPAAGAAPKNGTAPADDPKRAATKPAN
jgi:recombination protein RecA